MKGAGPLRKARQLLRLLGIYSAFRRRQVAGVPRPIRLWIEPTDRCNLRCVMCPTGFQEEGYPGGSGFMTFETFRKAIDEIRDFVFDVNLHHRGESLLHKELPRMIRYAADAGIYTNLHTNGTLLSPERSEALLGSGLDFLSFSFDAIDPEEYPRVRPGARFERTLEGIRTFLRLRRDHGLRRPAVAIEAIDFHPGDGTLAEKEARLRSLFPDPPPDRVRVKALHNWAGEYAGIEAGNASAFTPCTLLWYSLTILWDGRVLPCPQDTRGHLSLGNVNDSALLAIWDGAAMRRLRERMKHGEWRDLVPCRTCDRIFRPTRGGVPEEGRREFLWENLTR